MNVLLIVFVGIGAFVIGLLLGHKVCFAQMQTILNQIADIAEKGYDVEVMQDGEEDSD